MPELCDTLGRPQVAVTGLGVVTPGGNSLESLWQFLLTGESAAAPISRFDATALPVQFACEVRDFCPTDYVERHELRRLDILTTYAMGAAGDALRAAGQHGVPSSRSGVVVGTGIGGINTYDKEQEVFRARGLRKVHPMAVPMVMPNATAGFLSMRAGLQGPNLTITTACAAGAHAVGEGARLIRDRSADLMLVGGCEAAVTEFIVGGFCRAGALSTRNEDPAQASRPFDTARDGFVIGEGAAFLVLERLDHALTRGTHVHALVQGYGCNADAHHIVAPPPNGAGAVGCMRLALADAARAPEEIGHVNAHGTSTEQNDLAEASAFHTVFGAGIPPVTSAKGALGHLVGAAGAVEAIASILSIESGQVPPTANHTQTDPDVFLDIVAGNPREVGQRPVLSTSFGFGGQNATLVFAPYPEAA